MFNFNLIEREKTDFNKVKMLKKYIFLNDRDNTCSCGVFIHYDDSNEEIHILFTSGENKNLIDVLSTEQIIITSKGEKSNLTLEEKIYIEDYKNTFA